MNNIHDILSNSLYTLLPKPMSDIKKKITDLLELERKRVSDEFTKEWINRCAIPTAEDQKVFLEKLRRVSQPYIDKLVEIEKHTTVDSIIIKFEKDFTPSTTTDNETDN